MSRFGISLFSSLLFFPWCFPFNAQEPVAEQGDSVVSIETYEIPVSTSTRLFQLMIEAEQQGKTLFFRMDSEGEEYEKLIGLSEAQSTYLDSQLELSQEDEDNFDEYIKRLNQLAEHSAEEFNQFENTVIQFYSEALDKMETLIGETLTPIQLQKAMEYELTVPSSFFSTFADFLEENGEENGNFLPLNFAAYEVLNLSEEQKELMLELQKEIRSEIKVFFEVYAGYFDLSTKGLMEFLEQFAEMSEEEQQGFMEKLEEKMEKLQGRVKAVSQKLHEKINEILTPEQKDRLAAIREDVSQKLASIREELEKRDQENSDDESWKNSWKPGDPLPEGTVPPQRKPRFPLGI